MEKYFNITKDFIPITNRNKIVALIADNGGNFPEYGVIEGSYIFVDTAPPKEKSKLYCLISNSLSENNKKYKLSEQREIEGYDFLGNVVAVLNNFKECS